MINSLYMVKTLEEVSEESTGSYAVYLAGNQVALLAGGYAFAIVMKYYFMATTDQQRADDFMAGVIDGLLHASMIDMRKE
jgi:hypothetical protein